MDITILTAAISSLKGAKEIAQAMLELKVSAEIQTKVIDLQTLILAAQSSALQAQEEQLELARDVELSKKEIARLKAWEHERSRYVLKEVGAGAFAYTLKEDSNHKEPSHWLCCQCYQDGLKSILQYSGYLHSGKVFSCNRCKASINLRTEAAMATVAPVRRNRSWDNY
jgi:hypothetical protein